MKTDGQHKSQLQERRIAEELGGRVQPGSGSGDFAKGDVRLVGKLRVEAKTTSKRVYTLKLKDILKIRMEALTGGLENWVLQIEFQGQTGLNKKFAVVDYQWFTGNGGSILSHWTTRNSKTLNLRLADLVAHPWGFHWQSTEPVANIQLGIVPWHEFVARLESRQE